MEGVPLMNRDATSFQDYIEILLQLAIGIAALLVVLRIIWAGVQYMLSEVVTSKEAAKKSIGGALLGLIIILASVLILNTINPNLTRLDVLQSAPDIRGTGVGGNPPEPCREQVVSSADGCPSSCHALPVVGRSTYMCFPGGLQPAVDSISCPDSVVSRDNCPSWCITDGRPGNAVLCSTPS